MTKRLIFYIQLVLLAALSAISTQAHAANLVANPGFETGSLSPWSVYGKAAISKTNVHSGKYAAAIGTYSGVYQTISGLSPNTAYVLTGWAKVTKPGTPGDGSWILVKNHGGSPAQAAATTTYTQLSVTFVTGPSNTSAQIFGWSDTDLFRVDDFSLAPKPVSPTAALSTNPTSFPKGQSTSLSWSSTNATSCVGAGFSTGGAVSGSINVSPMASTTYSVTCSGAGVTSFPASAAVTVTAAVPTAVSLAIPNMSLPDNTMAGVLVATSTVTMSDGSQYPGTLAVNNPLFAVSGLNVVTARALTMADDGPKTATVSAGSASATLNIQVTSAMATACDAGKGMPVPAPAALAGFTRCALNADFTDPGGFYSNPANFLDCAGATGPYAFRFLGFGGSPCSRFTIDADGAVPQVAHMVYTQADIAVGNAHNSWSWPGKACCTNRLDAGGPNGTGLPIEGYYEITLRMPVASLNGNDASSFWLPLAVWNQKNDTYNTAYWLETDFFEQEMVGHSTPAQGWGWHLTAVHDWTCAPTCNGFGGIVDLGGPTVAPPLPDSQCPGGGGTGDCGDAYYDGAPNDFSTYHKYGFLMTSDEATHISMCVYIDDVLKRCQRGFAGTRPALQYKQQYNDFVIWLGSFGMTASQIDLYVQSMRVFECNTYNTATCPGPVICPNGQCYDGTAAVLPSGPSVPAGAAASGFTTLALNSDFTQTQPANWLGGCATPGNGAPLSPMFYDDGVPHIWWQNIWWSAQYQNCNVQQITDPVYGGTTLDMPWTVDNSFNSVGMVMETASWDYSATKGVSHDYPNNAYYEVTYRQSPAAAGNYAVLNTWGPQGISPSTWPVYGNNQIIEWDDMEPDAGILRLSDAAVHNWGNGDASAFLWVGFGPPGLPPGFDASQYHTFGMRVTSDGAGMEGCSYIDNVFQNCIALPGGLTPYQAANGRNFLVLQNACDYWNQPSGTCTQGQVQHLYVKSVRVWSCKDWQASQCNGPVLSGAP